VSEHPGEHPDPPADLDSREPLLITLDQPWFRIHSIERGAVFFGRTGRNRFDAPANAYGVLYLGADPHCAFIETFGQSTGIQLVTRASLAQRALARIRVSRPVHLIDLVSTGGLARVGADGRLCTGSHSVAQAWSQALRAHPCRPDGLYYPARHDLARQSCALYEEVGDILSVEQSRALSDPRDAALLGEMLDTYRFGLAD
jgi:hypothetical protein